MGDERFRLFCALQLPDDTVEAIAGWQQHLREEQGLRHAHAPRIVPVENLHVTLAFLGSRPATEVPSIARELAAAASVAGPVRLRAGAYRETRSVGMIRLEDIGGAATALARDVGERLERLGAYRPVERPWLPHVTVLRFRERPRLTPPPPGLEEIDAVRCAVYRSTPRPGGPRYEVLEAAALGGL